MSHSTIARILETASPHIRREGAGVAFSIVCTVEEGTACRFASAEWTDRTLEPLAERIADELGWKVAEHSTRRQVVVRCTLPEGTVAQARCEIDRGNGFTPLLVIEG